MIPGLPPSRGRNEVFVSSEDTRAILGLYLRFKDLIPKAGALSLPPSATLLYSKRKSFLSSWEDSKGPGWVAAALTLSGFLPSLAFRSHSGAVGCQ